MVSMPRRVLPYEYSKYCTHLKALDADSKVLRFAGPASDTVIDSLCNRFEANASQHILFCIENNDLEFVAVGHIALYQGMELALSVLKEHQGHGMGSLLMKRCIQWCRTHGALKGCMTCMNTNAAVKHLCAKHGIHTHSKYGESTANIELNSPSITTYLTEATDSNLAVMDYLSKRFTKPFNLLK